VDGSRIGESWELGQVADCDSPLEGNGFSTLSQAAAWDDGNWLGIRKGQFPLLIKLIDAREALSIQVHPSQDGPGFRAKNECWVVLEAPPGAFLYAGTETELLPDELVARLGVGDLSPLRKLPVSAGDVVMIPAGTIHAITAGLVIAEVQQASDTTYRLYDWGRVGLDGKPRELHLEAARRCVETRPNSGLKPVPVAVDPGREILCATPWFALARLRPGKGERMETRDRFLILMVLEGPVDLVWQGGRKVLEKGRTVLIPRGLQFQVAGGLLLEVWEPDWDRDILGPVLAAGHSRPAAYQLSAGVLTK
jgi:mannose-6-phosphate isomerase